MDTRIWFRKADLAIRSISWQIQVSLKIQLAAIVLATQVLILVLIFLLGVKAVIIIDGGLRKRFNITGQHWRNGYGKLWV